MSVASATAGIRGLTDPESVRDERSPRASPRAAVALLALLLGCSGAAGRLEAANAKRVAGDARGALGAYKELLAELGEGPLPSPDQAVRLKALRFAGDVSYLELGDYTGAISYYRRIVSIAPGTREAREARVVVGDIYRERFRDLLAAVAQYAEVAASDAPEAPTYQLEVAKCYLELRRHEQARTEARILRDRWPRHPLAEEGQLLTAQSLSLEKRDDEALRAFQALIDSGPRPETAARALEGQAHIHAQASRFDRALELYALALPQHPNPEAIRTAIDAVRERREKASPAATPGDRASAFGRGPPRPTPAGAKP